MKKLFAILMILVFALGLAACNRVACERYCDCIERNSGDSCVDDCLDDLDDEDATCRRKFRSYTRCLNRNDCDYEECEDEAEEMADEC